MHSLEGHGDGGEGWKESSWVGRGPQAGLSGSVLGTGTAEPSCGQLAGDRCCWRAGRGGQRQRRDGDITGGADSELAPASAARSGHFPGGQSQQEGKREKGAGGTRGAPPAAAGLGSLFRLPAPTPPPPRSTVLTAGPSVVM